MAIKLIGIDVDGTLLDSRNRLTAETVSALQEAADSGVEVVLATGRMLSECGELLAQLPMIHYAVTCTGTEVVDLQTQKTITRHSLTADQLRHLCGIFAGLDVMFQIFDSRDGLMHNSAWHLDHAERYCNPDLAKAIRRYHAAEADLDSYVAAYEGPTNKIHMFFGSMADKNEAVRRMEGEPFLWMDSQGNDLEIMPLGIDKGVGLRDLAEYLGLETENVMALGDSGNDIGMLRYAGLAVVMGNGTDEAKVLADRITLDNDHDGVAAAVRQVLREQKGVRSPEKSFVHMNKVSQIRNNT